MIYDIFYVSKQQVNADSWQQFRQRFPSAQKLDNVSSLEDIKRRSFTKFFWVVWDDLDILESFTFDYRVEKWDEAYIHVFFNGKFRDGICLFPKSVSVTKKEFDHRFYINKKELDIEATHPKLFDVIFISYNEINADANYEKLKIKRPNAKRVHGVKGIHTAHIEAAKLSSTDMFWVVDADAVIINKFNFEIDYIPHYNRNEKDIFLDTVHVWKSLNPVNGLVYGNGGVKLLPKKLVLAMDTGTADMTTSISKNFKVMPAVSNITAFNTDEFSTWRSAFRECVKLSSRVIDRNYDDETEERLMAWCSQGKNRPLGNYSIAGARLGKQYGETNINDKEKLLLINNFNWLKEEFIKWQIVNE